MRLAVFLIIALVAASVSRAETALYDLTMRGFKVGELTLKSQVRGSRYSLTGVIVNTGLTTVIRKFSYKGQAQGNLQGRNVRPSYYVETADTGRRASEVELRYAGGVPQIKRYSSSIEAAPNPVNPASQGGSLDPLSAVYALKRDVPAQDACRVDVTLFDGQRQSRMWMKPAGQDGGLPYCAGRYERQRGFTPKELSHHTHFDFVLRYRAGSNGVLVVDNVSFDSLYGQAVVVRKN